MKKNKYKLMGVVLAFLILFFVFQSSLKSNSEHLSLQSNSQIEEVQNVTDKKIPKIPNCLNSKIRGEWFSIDDGKKLKLNNDCSFENEKCKSFGSYEDFFLVSKDEKVKFKTKKISEVEIKDCSPIGDQECNYKLEKESEESVLVINCNENSLKFKQQYDKKNQDQNKILVDSGASEIKKANPEIAENTNHEENETDSSDLGIISNSGKGVMLNGSLCDGIKRADAKKCYYTNLPLLTVSKALLRRKYWSSSSLNIEMKKQFKTENVLNLRIVARKNGNGLSTFNKKCNESSFVASKLKVKIMLRSSENITGETATLISRIDHPSYTWNFTIPQSDQSLILDVIEVKSNSRCVNCKKSKYLDLQSGELKGFAKECAAFDIQFSTDTTYDLPGKRANKLLY